MPGQTFTTYINAKRTGSVDQEFAQMAQSAKRSFGDVQKSAEAANRAVGGLTGGRGTAGRSPITQAYLQGFDKAKIAADRVSEANARLARENSTLVRSLRTAGNTLQVVQGPLGPIAGRVNAAADALVRLTGVTLGLAGAGAALFAYVRAANQFVEVRSKLATLYDSQKDVNSAMTEVYGIAQRARTGLAPVVDLYSKLKLAADQFGFSQQRVSRITEIATKAAALSGGTTQSREAGLYQFSQAFGSGVLQGDELRSIRENNIVLARAISSGLGKLPEFKGIDTTIGKLKVLGEQGKLTSDVIARALEASAGDIEARYSKLPVTLGAAFDQLSNSATMFIGRFEETTGIVGNLATGVQLLGNNLNVVVALAGGVAASFGAIVAANKFREISNDISQWAGGIRASQVAAQTQLGLVTRLQASTEARTVALREEQAAIQANIAALEQEVAVQAQLARNADAGAKIGLSGATAQRDTANLRGYQATQQLADERKRLEGVNGAVARSEENLEKVNGKVATATAAASRSTNLLKGGLSALLGAINPLAIVVGLATTAFLEWALAESQAEKNAKKVEDAQRSLATVIDFTTGKIREQNQALLAGAKAKASEGVEAAKQQYADARRQIGGLNVIGNPNGSFLPSRAVGTRGGPQYSATQRQAVSVLEGVRSGATPLNTAVQLMETLARADPSLRSLSNRVAELAAGGVDAARKVGSLRSSIKIIEGTANDEDKRRAQGDFSGGLAQGETKTRDLVAESEALRAKLRNKRFAAETQMNESLANLEKRRGQMSADDYVRERAQIKATYDTAIASLDAQDKRASDKAEREEERKRKAHERELARIEKENQAREKRTDQRTDILGRYSEEPSAVVKAARDVRELNQLVGETMNGLAAITKDNPLGQGVYTQQMADGDAQRIAEGLQRPFQEYLKQRERDIQISSLMVAGHDQEAEALRRAFDLYDQVGAVTMDQYQVILQTVQAEERMNDTLAQRERILAPLRESASAVRDSITSAIEAITSGTNPLKVGQNLFKSLFQQVNRANAVQLAERLTGGLDERVRDLMRGSTSVDSKIADYLSALNRTKDGTETFGSAMKRAADAADGAAESLSKLASTPPGFSGPTASSDVAGGAAASLAWLGSSLPSSFYKPGTKVGSGVGDNIIFKAIGSLGAVITENLRSQSTQNALYKAGKTTAKVSDHTTSQETYDVRLPGGLSFAKATDLIKKQAKSVGYEVVKALDETLSGGTGPHGHYVFAKGAGGPASAVAAAQASSPIGALFGGGVAGLQAREQQVEVVSSLKGVAQATQTLANNPLLNLGGGGGVVQRSRGGAIGRSLFGTATEDTYNAIGQQLGGKLDKVFGTKFMSGIGAKLGTALQGAQTGSMVAGVGKMLWGKFSTTGAQIGGAIGSVIPIPGGDIIGSIIGGTIGGLLKKTKKGSVTLSGSGGQINLGAATGNSAKEMGAATDLGGQVQSALQSIADQIGATIGSFSVSIGSRHGDIRVDTSGRGVTKIDAGAKDFNQDAAGAVQYALMDAIRDGALQGISAASQAILQHSTDIQKAVNKVMVIESIPRRLMALKDPVRAAIIDLNTEFSQMISYLKEGGATAEQYAQAQELYNLERQKVIEQASQQSTNQIQDYIDNMLGGQDSPLNKRTVYDNARNTLNPLAADVMAGKAVDSDALLKAVQNFQSASRELNGSDSSFFSDFDYILGLLQKAKANVLGATTPYDTSTLPGSPFSDASIQAIINGGQATVDAINNQTNVLGGLLAGLYGSAGGGGGGGGGESAIDILPRTDGGYYGDFNAGLATYRDSFTKWGGNNY